MTSRRNFLGLMASALAMPAIGAVVPAAPARRRGETSVLFHIDEAAFYPTAGDMWINPQNGLVHYRTEAGTWEPLKRKQGPTDMSMFQQNYTIPLEEPRKRFSLEVNVDDNDNVIDVKRVEIQQEVVNPFPEKTYTMAFGEPIYNEGAWRQPKTVDWAKIDKDFGEKACVDLAAGKLTITVGGKTVWTETV